ncbi:MAG: phosphotriesterase [Christensenellaceae bacterium]|nr:phosphotriesterase [Christensenellaceae bacterium]
MIHTVCGLIPPEALGFCHSHEHLCILDGQSARINPALRIDDEDLTLRELLEFKAAGGGAVVDAQPVGCGRGAAALRRLSEKSGVHVIASTGFHKMEFYPADHWIFTRDEKQLTDLFCTELRSGMYLDGDAAFPACRSDIKAGQIKAALGAGPFHAQYRKLFAAAASAAVATGAPLMVHIEPGSDVQIPANFLARQGVNLSRVIFCHMDRAVPDMSVHTLLCERGITLEYDTIAREKYHSDAREVEIVQCLLQAGHAGRLLMGLDVTKRRIKAYGGAPGLSYIQTHFLPQLRQCGVEEDAIQKIFYANPARIFSF